MGGGNLLVIRRVDNDAIKRYNTGSWLGKKRMIRSGL